MDPLKKILKDNATDGIFHTHVSMLTPKGRFQFTRETLEEFWKIYCQVAEERGTKFGVAEKPQQYLPVLVDVDLRLKDDGGFVGDGLYTNHQLLSVVEMYQGILRQIVENCESEDLYCVVLEKSMYQQTKNDVTCLKHGFHLHFPYLFLSRSDQEIHLIPRIQSALKEAKTFSTLGIEDSGTVVDKGSCNVPWLLYGSRKNEESEPYEITRILDDSLSEISIEKAFRNYKIYDHRERPIDIKGKILYYMPRILSIIPHGRSTKELRRGLICPLKEKMRQERKSSVQNYDQMPSGEGLEIAKRILPLLADWRADDYKSWMAVGWILYNITNGEPEGADLWCEFSSRCADKYNEGECLLIWDKMTRRDNGYTIGTLMHFASLDSPDEYKKFKSERSQKYVLSSLEGSHNDVAKALYEEYGDQFRCASVTGKGVWYFFKGHRWQQMEEGIYLRDKISGNFVSKYIDAVKKLYDELGSCSEKSKQASVTERIKQVNKMITNLKNNTFKNAVMREAADVFYDPNFLEKLNANPNIIGFKNGIYDLLTNTFRPGVPDDYVSNTLPINYIEFSEEDPRVQEVHTFLEQIFPDKSMRRYFMDVSSDVFQGGNPEKTIQFWTGDGDNGKSITQTIFEKMFGNKLAIKLNTTVATGKKPSAGAAFADLARAGEGTRWVAMEEPDGDEALNIGILKAVSGGDSYFARDLYEKGKSAKEIVPMFKIVFVCNKLPSVRNPDKAFWNRVRVMEFESTFCRPDNPAPETYEEQLRQKRFPMDKKFSQKIPAMLEPFAWVLLNHRKNITVRIEPEKVRQATELYRKRNDVYRKFCEECIIEAPEKYMSSRELYDIFKEWFHESMPRHPIPIKNDMEEYFVKIWGIPEPGRGWKGYRQRTVNDALASGDIVVVEETDLRQSGMPPI